MALIEKYVSVDQTKASDANNGDNMLITPWKTIQHGVDWFAAHLKPLDEGVLNLETGSYNESVKMHGEQYSRITIQAWSLGAYNPDVLNQYCEARPQIGGDPSTSTRINANVFEIIGTAKQPVNKVRLINLTILLGKCGIKAEHVKELYLDSCCIHDNISPDLGGGFSFQNCPDCVVLKCRVWSNTAQTVGGGGGHVESTKGVEILISKFWGNIASQDDGGALFIGACKDVKISSCEIGAKLDPPKNSGPNFAKFSFAAKKGGNGGGVSLKQSESVLSKNYIEFNESQRHGGGISVMEGKLNISEDLITSNAAYLGGGGIMAEYCDLEMWRDVRVDNNWAKSAGGGIRYVEGDSPHIFKLNDIQVRDNTTRGSSGGGLHFRGQTTVPGKPSITGCTFRHNRAPRGAGVFINAREFYITGTRFEENAARTDGGGGFFENLEDGEIARNEIWDNRAHSGAGFDFSDCDMGPGSLAVRANDFKKNQLVAPPAGANPRPGAGLDILCTKCKGANAPGLQQANKSGTVLPDVVVK